MYQRQPGFGLIRRRHFLEVLMLFVGSGQHGQSVGRQLSGQSVNTGQGRLQRFCGTRCPPPAWRGLPLPRFQSRPAQAVCRLRPGPVYRNACHPQRHHQVQSDWEACTAVPVDHGLTDFPQHAAGSGPGNTQVFGCPQGGDAAFIRSYGVNGPGPLDQGHPGGMKHSSGSVRIDRACARQ